MPSQKNKQPTGLYLFFTGKRLWLAGGRVPSSYVAYSGKDGKYDPIPDGRYWVRFSELHRLEFFDDLSQKLVGDVINRGPGKGWLAHQTGWGNYRIPIRQDEAQAKANGRGNFFIHGGDIPGSAGCIDLVSEMDVFVGQLTQEEKWANQDRIPLYVHRKAG
jgi:hypothetical protein